MKRKRTNESFKESLHELLDKLRKLQGFYSIIPSQIETFQLFTEECIKILRDVLKISTNEVILSVYLNHYIKKYWFHHYLAIKDELAVLRKGELQRPYHQQEHRDMKHQRGHEQIYFLNKYELSSCSCDGMDYEYRMLANYRPDYLKLEILANGIEEVSNKLHQDNESVDSYFYNIRSSIITSSLISSVDISCLHNNEYIKIYFKNDDIKPFKLSRLDMSIDSTRVLALSTIIEDPEDHDIIHFHRPISLTPNNISHSTHRSVRKLTAIVIDSDSDDDIDDEDDEDNDDNSNNTKLLKSQVYENISTSTKELLFDDSTNNISLKEIKLAHGVDEDERDRYDSDGNLIDDTEENGNINDSEIKPSITHSKKKDRLITSFPSSSSSLTNSSDVISHGLLHGKEELQRTEVSKSSIPLHLQSDYLLPKNTNKTIILKVVDPIKNETIFIDLPVHLTWNISYLELSNHYTILASASEIVDIVMKELWFDEVPKPWIPMDLVLGDQIISTESSFLWNIMEPLVVRCHKSIELKSFCCFLRDYEPAKILWQQAQFNESMAKIVIKVILNLSKKLLKILSNAYQPSNDIVEIDLSLYGRSLTQLLFSSSPSFSFINMLTDAVMIVTSSKIFINARCSEIHEMDLVTALNKSSILDLTCSNLPLVTLSKAIDVINNHCIHQSKDIFHSWKCECLILQYNRHIWDHDMKILTDYCKQATVLFKDILSYRQLDRLSDQLFHEDNQENIYSIDKNIPHYLFLKKFIQEDSIWIKFACSVFGNMKSMKSIDISYMITSSSSSSHKEEHQDEEREQQQKGHIYTYGILLSLYKRKDNDFLPLERILMRGMTKLSTTLVEEFLTHMRLRFPDYPVDCGG